MMDYDFIEREYNKIKEICDRYNINCFLRFEEIYIKTAYESWYFIPSKSGIVTLMHGNGVGQYPNGYHIQFSRPMKYDDIITYIKEHGMGKFLGKKMRYTFTKDGKRINRDNKGNQKHSNYKKNK